MDIIITILSYIAVWFLGACSLAALVCYWITQEKKKAALRAQRTKNLIDSLPDAPKPGPILVNKPGPNPFTP